jgi:hypothetical protein
MGSVGISLCVPTACAVGLPRRLVCQVQRPAAIVWRILPELLRYTGDTLSSAVR